jgi:hypothetical protein
MKPGQRWAPGQRKRPTHNPPDCVHPSSTPLSLHDGNLASHSWWNPLPAGQSVSERGV